ncbi:alpha/beta fold hydrolase [Peribacillus sp. SCS-37]|uniref:alpha/beta fold hydrolase n=1 Tax=Paraperibacillus esterisolvens TaxID=3115296 RepID=UPI003905D615
MIKKQLITEGRKVSYLEVGPGDGVTVLFLHGVPESSMVWSEILPAAVSEGFRGIAPDLPGFGDSVRFNEKTTWERYVEFVSEFLDELSIEKVHLVVHDWGGLIGLAWAGSHPERVLSITASNTTISKDYSWHKLAKLWRTPVVGEGVIKGMTDWEKFAEGMRKSAPGINEETLRDFHKAFRSPESGEVVLELYRSGNKDKVLEYEGMLSGLMVPVSIIWGKDDPYVPVEFAEKLKAETLPQATVHIIPNVGHFIQIESPEAFSGLLLDHF